MEGYLILFQGIVAVKTQKNGFLAGGWTPLMGNISHPERETLDGIRAISHVGFVTRNIISRELMSILKNTMAVIYSRRMNKESDMKKALVALCLLFCASMVQAVEIGDYIKATLLDNVSAMSMYGFAGNDQGPARLSLVDSIFKIGKFDKASIVDVQAGFFGNANDVSGESQFAHWIYGAQLRIDPFVKHYIPLPAQWEFLHAIQHGPVAFYDATEKDEFFGYSVGLSFDLQPNVE